MIRVQREDFDVGAEIRRLADGNAAVGGVVTFIGRVRAGTGPSAIRAMTLEHYPGMTERKLVEIEAEARARWTLTDILIVHRFGRLEPGEQIVLVITAAAHRDTAFAACEFLVDWLKTRAPFWKMEETAEGEKWVAAEARDDEAAKRWTND